MAVSGPVPRTVAAHQVAFVSAQGAPPRSDLNYVTPASLAVTPAAFAHGAQTMVSMDRASRAVRMVVQSAPSPAPPSAPPSAPVSFAPPSAPAPIADSARGEGYRESVSQEPHVESPGLSGHRYGDPIVAAASGNPLDAQAALGLIAGLEMAAARIVQRCNSQSDEDREHQPASHANEFEQGLVDGSALDASADGKELPRFDEVAPDASSESTSYRTTECVSSASASGQAPVAGSRFADASVQAERIPKHTRLADKSSAKARPRRPSPMGGSATAARAAEVAARRAAATAEQPCAGGATRRQAVQAAKAVAAKPHVSSGKNHGGGAVGSSRATRQQKRFPATGAATVHRLRLQERASARPSAFRPRSRSNDPVCEMPAPHRGQASPPSQRGAPESSVTSATSATSAAESPAPPIESPAPSAVVPPSPGRNDDYTSRSFGQSARTATPPKNGDCSIVHSTRTLSPPDERPPLELDAGQGDAALWCWRSPADSEAMQMQGLPLLHEAGQSGLIRSAACAELPLVMLVQEEISCVPEEVAEGHDAEVGESETFARQVSTSDSEVVDLDTWRSENQPQLPPDINTAVDEQGRTKLIYAASEGEADAVQDLLDQGAAVDVADDLGCTALTYAASRGHLSVLQILVGAGADLEQATNEGWTPLLTASVAGQSFAVGCLLELGACTETRDARDWSALMHASFRGHLSVVSCLLRYGASALARDDLGRTALAYAVLEGHLDIVQTIVDHLPPPTSGLEESWDEAISVALHAAVVQNRAEAVRCLLKRPVPAASRTSAVRLAVESGHHDIVETLIRQADVEIACNGFSRSCGYDARF